MHELPSNVVRLNDCSSERWKKFSRLKFQETVVSA